MEKLDQINRSLVVSSQATGSDLLFVFKTYKEKSILLSPLIWLQEIVSQLLKENSAGKFSVVFVSADNWRIYVGGQMQTTMTNWSVQYLRRQRLAGAR